MKSQGPKSQFYHYSLRSVATSNILICNHRIFLYITPPEDALTIENVNCHIVIVFDSAVASGDRILSKIGITSEFPVFGSDPQYMRVVEVNKIADVNRLVDLNIDLSSMLKKDNVTYEDGITGNYLQNNMTMIMLEFPATLINNNNVGTIHLWKADAIFTTKEIR